MIKLINYPLTLGSILKWKGHIWLPTYLKDRVSNRRRIANQDHKIDIIFLIADHFEPSRREGNLGVQRVRDWCRLYEEMVEGHFDSDGYPPQHTWFYRYDYPNIECIKILSDYVQKGFGEIEFHLHHSSDTEESFANKIRSGVDWFNQVGAMITNEEKPKKYFGYVAGNWALDSGNNDLKVLKEAGCYADFTFPAFGSKSQPKKVNSIYYAINTSGPKSYNSGVDVEVGKPESGELMIFEGPIWIDWEKRIIDYGAIEPYSLPSPDRVISWLNAHVHVKGRPEWIFIKLHCHGIQGRDVFLNESMKTVFRQSEIEFYSIF